MVKYILVAITLLSYPLMSQGRISSSSLSKVGTTAGQFLKIGVSARSIGMGGAFVAIADDIGALSINPAGLALVNGYSAMFTHTEWIANTTYAYGAASFNMGSVGSLGLMVSSFSSGDMKVRTVDQPEGTNEMFNAQDLMVGLTYSRSLTENFSIGFTAKYVNQQIWHMSASSIAFDLGTLFKTPIAGIVLGASIRNFGSGMQLEGRDNKFADDPDNNNMGNVAVVNALYEMQTYSLPLYFQVGVARTFSISEDNKLTIAVDAITPNDNYEAVNAGFEYGWNESLFLRAGMKSMFQDDTEEGMTAGIGFKFRLEGTSQIQIDYAYADMGRLKESQRFSLLMYF